MLQDTLCIILKDTCTSPCICAFKYNITHRLSNADTWVGGESDEPDSKLRRSVRTPVAEKPADSKTTERKSTRRTPAVKSKEKGDKKVQKPKRWAS